MKNLKDLRQFHQEINGAYRDLEITESFPDQFYDAFLNGENTLYQKSITEIKTFHEDWIETIESFFPSLNKIIRDPKSGLRYEQDVVAIEKAKKTGSDSVRHLTQNTHLIKEMRGGNVVPKGILITQAEIDYAIYENRFIKTLVDRLFDFVNRRYHLVKENMDSFTKKHFDLKSTFEIEDSKVDLEVNFKVKDDVLDHSVNENNTKLVNRIHNLLKLVNGLRLTPFIEGLKNAKPVKAPIMQTSILLKNIDYKNCYTLWLYLDKYHTLDFDVDVEEKNLTFDRFYMKNIYQMALQTFTTIYGNQKALDDHYQYLDVKTYKRKSPTIITKRLQELVETEPSIRLDDPRINQYYLDQQVSQFKKSIHKNVDESSSYDVGLKKALREMIGITNAIYEQTFNLSEDFDEDYIFKVLVKEHTEDEIKALKQKLKTAQLIRETKEIDYNQSVRLEKNLMKEIDKLNRKLIKENKKKIKDESIRLRVEERIKLERENLKFNRQILSDYIADVTALKKTMVDDHRVMKKKIDDTKKQIKSDEENIIKQEKLKAKQSYEAELKKIKARQKIEKAKLLEKQKAQKKKDQENYKKQQAILKEKSKLRIQKEKAKLKAQNKRKLDKAKQT